MEHIKFKGSKNMDGDAITGTFTRLGAKFNASTSYDRTVFFVCTLIEHAKLVTDILLELVFNARYDRVDIQKECKVVLEELQMDNNHSKLDINNTAQKAILSPKNPYHKDIIGEEECLKKVRAKDFVKFHDKHYGDFMVMINCPKSHHSKINRFVEHKLASCRIPPVPKKLPPPNVTATEYSVSVQVNESTHYSTTLTFKGYPRSHPRYYLLDFVAQILAPGFKTLLFDELRVKRGLVYSVDSDYFAYDDIGFVCISFSSSNKNTDEMVKIVMKIIGDMKHMRTSRLKKYKEAYINSLNYSLTNRSMQSVFYGEMYDREPEFKLEKLIRQVRSISNIDLGNIADAILNSKNMGITTLGQYKNSDTMMDSLVALLNNTNQR